MSETPHAYLVLLAGGPARVVPLALGETIAGRAPEVTLLLANVEISRRHCRFQYDGAQCVLEDLGSTRGTRVNGTRITGPRVLQAGDKVGLGSVVLQYGVGEPPEVEAMESSSVESAASLLVHGVNAASIPTTEVLVLGREPGGAVVLDDPGVSRRHAQLLPQPGGGCVVRDLHSTAGSFVNGHRFDAHELTVGDRLQIGPFCFQYDGSALVRLSAARGASVQARQLVQRISGRTILDGLTFTIPPSHFAGILGPSGAGKSTLLNTLAGLDEPEGGIVFIDREDIYARGEPPFFGYVPQDDIVHRELTVRQALRFAARLRLPSNTPAGEIERLLEQTMEQLGLSHCAALPIRRLSGGQRKRVSVGVELLVRPAILFLDEPSSGLDPATEFQLMELLRDLADSGCTIVCTTHVIENAYLMDQLMVVMGGCLAFQGTAQETREYFGVAKLIALYERLQQQPPAAWKERLEAHRPAPEPLPEPSERRAPAIRARRRLALPILLQRQAAIFAADWRNYLLVFGEPLVVGGLVAWVTSEQELALFFAYLAVLWFGCSNAAQEIVKERPVFRRERVVGVGVHAYLCSKFLFQFALTSAQALLLYGTLTLGFGPLDGASALHLASILGLALVAVGLGTAISALARNLMQAVLVVPLLLIPQILFCGQTEPASGMSAPVYAVARLMPSFAAQKLMETSYFWQREVGGETLSRHHTAFTNLQRAAPVRAGTVYQESGPMRRALLTFAVWVLLSYAVAWWSLRRPEKV